jgi:hypothetical protein
VIFLTNGQGLDPGSAFICDARFETHDARCNPVPKPVDLSKGLTVVYPREFNEGAAPPLPLRPGVYWFAWRENKGTTANFLIGVRAEIKADGSLDAQEWFADPMVGKS